MMLIKKLVSLPSKGLSKVKSIIKDLVKHPDHFLVTSIFAMLCFVAYLAPIPDKYAVFNLQRLFEHPSNVLFWLSLPLSWVCHNGFNHLLNNMLFFLFLAPRVEKKLGTMRFAWLLVSCGLGSTLLFCLDGNWDAMVLGASGIVYGVIGAFIVFSKRRMLSMFLIPVVFLDVLEQFAMRILPTHVALMGHVGGFVTGLIIALWFLAFKRDSLPLPKKTKSK